MKKIVDEIVIVDTGSCDRSVDIAKVFGAAVYTYRWRNDFARSRNYSLSKAKAAWILILDADELVAGSDQRALAAMTQAPQAERCAYRFITRNYTNDVGTEGWRANSEKPSREQIGAGWYPSEKVRLFPNDSRIRFENAVHELVEPSLKRIGISIQKATVPIHHYGLVNSKETAAKKENYFNLGKIKIIESQADIIAVFEHAIQAQEIGDYETALELLQKVLEHCPEFAKAYFNMSFSYIQLEKYDLGLVAAEKALTLDPNLKEADLNCALCQIRMGDIKQALAGLNKFISANPNHPLGMGLLAIAHCVAGQRQQGLRRFDEIRRLGFDCPEYILEHSAKLIAAGRSQDAQQLVNAVSGGPYENNKIRLMRGDLNRSQIIATSV